MKVAIKLKPLPPIEDRNEFDYFCVINKQGEEFTASFCDGMHGIGWYTTSYEGNIPIKFAGTDDDLIGIVEYDRNENGNIQWELIDARHNDVRHRLRQKINVQEAPRQRYYTIRSSVMGLFLRCLL